MSSWFGLGGADEDDKRQKSSLIANDKMDQPARGRSTAKRSLTKESSKKKKKKEDTSLFGSAMGYANDFVMDVFGDDEEEETKKKLAAEKRSRSKSKGRKGTAGTTAPAEGDASKRDRSKSKSRSKSRSRAKSKGSTPTESGQPVKSVQKAVQGANEAERMANEMAQAMSWWNTHTVNEATKGSEIDDMRSVGSRDASVGAMPPPETSRRAGKKADVLAGRTHVHKGGGGGSIDGLDNMSVDLVSVEDMGLNLTGVGKFRPKEQVDLLGDINKRSMKARPVNYTSDDKPVELREKDSKVVKELSERTQKMKDAISWWSKVNSKATVSDEDLAKIEKDVAQGAVEMTEIANWWADKGKIFKSQNDTRRAAGMRMSLEKYHGDGIKAEDKAKEMANSLKWWRKNHATYTRPLTEYQVNVDKLAKVNHLFDSWEVKDLPEAVVLDPSQEPKVAEKLAREMDSALATFLRAPDEYMVGDTESGFDEMAKV